jgi:hypothetical protein
VDLPARNRLDPERDAAIVQAYRAGELVARIARQYGVTQPRVRRIAARAGVPARYEARAGQYPRGPAAEARVFSRRLVKALARYGVVPQKTASMKLSEAASRRAAVWLGVLDGDGSVGVYRDGRASRLSFAGTEALMEQCERFWREQLGIDGARPSARPHAGGIWTFNLSCAKAEAAARLLLAASPVSMRRKRELLAQIAGRTT